MDTESFQLSLEQQFQMKKLEAFAHDMDKEEMVEALLQMSRIMMVKDNIIKDLVKEIG